MMERLALKDDQTSTGGRVMGASSDFYNEEGRPFACAEDKATCGNCKGLWPIAGNARNWMDEGRGLVKDLAPVYCPCGKNRVFASGTSSFFYSEDSGPVETIQTSIPTETYDQQYTLKDANGQLLANVPYRVRLGSEVIASGITNSQGMTHANHHRRLAAADARNQRSELIAITERLRLYTTGGVTHE